MLHKRKALVVLFGILFIFAMAGCSGDKAPPVETEVSDDEPIPVETVETEDIPVEEPKEYTGWVGAYLGILAENSVAIERSYEYNPDGPGPVAILDVFGDETPELLYIYWYEDYGADGTDDNPLPCLALKIVTFSEAGGAEPIGMTRVFYAASSGTIYRVYLTHERELMLYLVNSYVGGSMGFWQIALSQGLEFTEEHVSGYRDELAKLCKMSNLDEFDEETLTYSPIYMEYGKEISREQYDKAVEEIKEDIECVIFLGVTFTYNGEIWESFPPFEPVCMTYAEAVSWLEAQGDSQQ